MLKLKLQQFAEEVNEDAAKDHDEQEEHGTESKESEKQSKTFTQEQVSKMMAREKSQGRNSIMKELGIDPNDENALSKLKDLINSQKTDDEVHVEEDNLANELAQKLLIAEAKAEALQMGFKEEFVDDVVVLSTNAANDIDGIKTKLVEVKSKYPAFMKTKESEEQESKGTGSNVSPKKSTKTEGDKSIGKRLAAQRKASSNSKKSYWGK